jgi:hypothetical protein
MTGAGEIRQISSFRLRDRKQARGCAAADDLKMTKSRDSPSL